MGLLPDPPVITVPAKATGKIKTDALVVEINARLGKSGGSNNPNKLPEGQDFKDLKTPLRIEIESLFQRILPEHVAGMSAHQRNEERTRVVREYLETNYPNRRGMRERIIDDLHSYPQWEWEDGNA